MHLSDRSMVLFWLLTVTGLLLQGCVMTGGSRTSQLVREKDQLYLIKDPEQCRTHRLVEGGKLFCFDRNEVYTGFVFPLSATEAAAYSREEAPVLTEGIKQTRTLTNPERKQKTAKLKHKVTKRRFGSHPMPKGQFFHETKQGIYAPDGSTCKKDSADTYSCTNGVVYRFKGKDRISGTDGRQCKLVKGSWQCEVHKKYVIKM